MLEESIDYFFESFACSQVEGGQSIFILCVDKSTVADEALNHGCLATVRCTM